MKTTKELARELGLLRRRSTPHGHNVRKVKGTGQPFAYLVVLDYESTCWEGSRNRPQEIIEFPAVLLNTSTGEIESEFQFYVLPQENPILSAFCKELTGITQDQVDEGIPLPICLKQFTHWLDRLGREKDVKFNRDGEADVKRGTFVTWSDWDLSVCLQYECKRKQILKPSYFNSWIDLRATYRTFYDRKPNGLNGALQDVGIQFEGREHSGLHDARNTARLAWRMICDGCEMKITKSLNKPVSSVKALQPPIVVQHNTDTASAQGPSANNVESKSKQDTGKSVVFGRKRSYSNICSPRVNTKFAENDLTRTPTSKRSKQLSCSWTQASPRRSPRLNKTPQPVSVGTPSKTPNKPKFMIAGNLRRSPRQNNGMGKSNQKITPSAKFSSYDIYCDKSVHEVEKLSSSRQGYESNKPRLQVQNTNQRLDDNNSNIQSKTMTTIQKKVPLGENWSSYKPVKPAHICPVPQVRTPSHLTSNTENSLEYSVMTNQSNFKMPSPVNSNIGSKFNPNSVKSCDVPGQNRFKTPSPVGLQQNIASIFKTPSPVDQTNLNRSSSLSHSCSSNNSFNTSNYSFNTSSSCSFNTLSSDLKATPPLCKCGKRTKRRYVQSPGPNQGRPFFSCPLGKSMDRNSLKKCGCDFFKWEPSNSTGGMNRSITSPITNYMSSSLSSSSSLPSSVNQSSIEGTDSNVIKKSLGISRHSVIRPPWR